MRYHDLIQKPMITEQALQKAKRSVYGFYVHKKATKSQIKAGVQQLFGVEVASVKTAIRKGKLRKVGKRMVKKNLPDYKIAYVTVRKGKIDLFPQT